jgi:NADH-quinone oxidoreductase subunit C
MTLNFALSKQLLVWRHNLLVLESFGTLILCSTINAYNLTLYCRASTFVLFLKILKFHYYSRLNQLSELTCVDYPMRANRFYVMYFFLSCFYNYRLNLVLLGNSDYGIPSITSLFAGSAWQEREAWDMFGILFNNHPDMRRILTDYGFLGHPLRKDFPLSGFVEAYFNDMTQLVSYQPLSLAQEFRDFGRVSNPWLLS